MLRCLSILVLNKICFCPLVEHYKHFYFLIFYFIKIKDMVSPIPIIFMTFFYYFVPAIFWRQLLCTGVCRLCSILHYYRCGPKIVPWSTPISSFLESDFWLPIIICLHVFSRYPMDIISWRRPSCHTRSKSVSTSRNTIPAASVVFNPFVVISTNLSIYSSMD